MNTYMQLKKIVLPNLTGFQDDLLVQDKKSLKGYDGKFLYAYRDNGTNLFLLENIKDFDYSKSIDELQNTLYKIITYFKGNNKNFLFCDGETIISIDWEKLHTIFKGFAEKVYNRKRYIDSLNIDSLAFDLIHLIANKKLWKKMILEDVTSDSLRRLRNKFDWKHLKKTESFEDMKKQLLQLAI